MIPKVQFNSDTRKHESCNASTSDLISPVSIVQVHHTPTLDRDTYIMYFDKNT